MPSRYTPLLQYLRRLACPSPACTAPDAELLRRFVHHHDEAAFAALVARHGPLVLRVEDLLRPVPVPDAARQEGGGAAIPGPRGRLRGRPEAHRRVDRESGEGPPRPGEPLPAGAGLPARGAGGGGAGLAEGDPTRCAALRPRARGPGGLL